MLLKPNLQWPDLHQRWDGWMDGWESCQHFKECFVTYKRQQEAYGTELPSKLYICDHIIVSKPKKRANHHYR